jgi:ATP-dependent DNA helicase PIF1
MTNKVIYVKKKTKTETCMPTVEDDAQTFCVEPVRVNPSQPRKRKLKDVGQQDDGHEKRRDKGHKVDQEGEQKKEECLDNIQAMAIQLALKKSVLILGEGGTGKSFLFERLMRDFGNKLMVVKTAPTGSAALRIGGKTVHSWAGVARADKDVQDLVRFVKRSRWATARWKDVDVLILDEISMVSAELLDKLDQVGRAVRKNDAPFGGIRVVASGDFLQLQPVNGEFCFGAACFDDLFPEDSRVVLTRNFRQANDKLFRRILTNMRAGSLTDEDIQALQSRVGAERSGQALYVYATNAEVNHMNTAKLAATTGTSRTFKDEFVQFHSMSADDAARLEAELSNAPCVEMLKLKICARVMLIVNKKFSKCSPKVNGSTGLVTNFDAQGNPEVLFDDGDVCTVMKHSWFTSCKKMSRTQYPLVLAWAVTIHKMQGATIPNATLILNLGSHIFSPCQAYVALSRACSLDQVVLEDFDASSIRSNPEAIAFTSACMQAQQERLDASSKASPKD